jgi:cysteine dioxygenase
MSAHIPFGLKPVATVAGKTAPATPAQSLKGKKIVVDIFAKSCALPLVAHPSAPPPLTTLFSDLAAAFAATRRSGVAISSNQSPASFAPLDARVRSLAAAYLRASHADWRHYAKWNKYHYVRHLVDANDDFEMMLICWAPGQASHVHNHAGSHCWLTVVDGLVDELRYRCDDAGDDASELEPPGSPQAVPGVLGVRRHCPRLDFMGANTVSPGVTAYIKDEIALHAVACPAACPGAGAVTLHIYAPPIRKVELYESESDRVVQRVPGFCTVRGQATALVG